MNPKIVSLVGLTASGKSTIGIKLAQKFNGEIISADSRQVYRGLDIGTAKVTPQEQKLVPHHLIDVVDPPKDSSKGIFDVFQFQQLAYAAIDDILKRKKLPIIIGGTGLYSRSIIEGYEFQNISSVKTNSNPKYTVLQICLMPPREYIRQSIIERIKTRLDQGMIEETQKLIEQGVSPQWLQSLGLEYYWNIELISGHITPDEYVTQLTTKTMQFAKRQRTWFKKEKNTFFLTEPSVFMQTCEKLVKEFIQCN